MGWDTHDGFLFFFALEVELCCCEWPGMPERETCVLVAGHCGTDGAAEGLVSVCGCWYGWRAHDLGGAA